MAITCTRSVGRGTKHLEHPQISLGLGDRVGRVGIKEGYSLMNHERMVHENENATVYVTAECPVGCLMLFDRALVAASGRACGRKQVS